MIGEVLPACTFGWTVTLVAPDVPVGEAVPYNKVCEGWSMWLK